MSSVSAKFLDAMAMRGKTIVSPADVVEILGHSPHQAAVLLGQLHKRGLLTRLKRGYYTIVPLGKDEEFGNPNVVAKMLVGEKPYYVSHLGAMSFHNLLLQPSRVVHVTTTGQLTAKEIGGLRYVFVTAPRKSIWGFFEEWVGAVDRVRIADIERTIVDACDRPDLCGGIVDVANGIWLARDRINALRLRKYLIRLGRFVVAKRVGFLFELLGICPKEDLDKIRGIATKSESYSLLDPVLPVDGRFVSRWKLRLNVDDNEIRESVTT